MSLYRIVFFDKDRKEIERGVAIGDGIIEALEAYKLIYGWDDEIAGFDIMKIEDKEKKP